MFEKEIPFNSLPPLPPNIDLETKEILKKAISANKALAEVSMACKQLPNEGVFYNVLFLEEAKDSSEIENIITTNDDLFQALASNRSVKDQNTKEVLHYSDALWKGLERMAEKKVLNINIFIEVVQQIKSNTSGIRVNPGTKIANGKTGKVVYTPPEGEQIIREKLRELEEYIHVDDGVDPLIRMSLIHYQFEAIHPFSDGNGRTGRIISILYLVYIGLIQHPLLFMSQYIIKNKDAYYTGLRSVTEKESWEQWVLYMLDAVEVTSKDMTLKVFEITDLMKETKDAIRTKLPNIYSKDLLEILFRLPYCKVGDLVAEDIVKRQTASVYLKELEKIGILRSVKVGREVLYVNTKFFDILKR